MGSFLKRNLNIVLYYTLLGSIAVEFSLKIIFLFYNIVVLKNMGQNSSFVKMKFLHLIIISFSLSSVINIMQEKRNLKVA